jgi:hypothetical protein
VSSVCWATAPSSKSRRLLAVAGVGVVCQWRGQVAPATFVGSLRCGLEPRDPLTVAWAPVTGRHIVAAAGKPSNDPDTGNPKVVAAAPHDVRLHDTMTPVPAIARPTRNAPCHDHPSGRVPLWSKMRFNSA